MSTRWAPAEALLELETLLIPALSAAAERHWHLPDARLFWRYDPSLRKPLEYLGPDGLVLRGPDLPLGLLIHTSALVLLRYIPAPKPVLYDLVCHGLAADLTWEVGPHVTCQAPTVLPLARELLQIDPDLALRVRELGEGPPTVASVAPLVFDQRLPAWLRHRLRHAALLTDSPQAQATRREAGLWRWLSAGRFEHLWTAIVEALGEQPLPPVARASADQT
ncbi:MAG: hypothetical protein M5U01_31605 [Ardenticatenaceae bacterium]|nr:hypothetical protein [Ardenticatenaceae bacterium]HBY93828.1 hypothetical protein [Chloroflexota bacterium]